MSIWPAYVFGAPGAALALLVSIGGLLHDAPGWLVAGAVLSVPSAVYLGGHPGLAAAWLLPLCPAVAAYLLHRGRRTVAGVLLAPNALATLWLILATLRNLG